MAQLGPREGLDGKVYYLSVREQAAEKLEVDVTRNGLEEIKGSSLHLQEITGERSYAVFLKANESIAARVLTNANNRGRLNCSEMFMLESSRRVFGALKARSKHFRAGMEGGGVLLVRRAGSNSRENLLQRQ